ncbi:tetratricopeptide repeat protein [Hymenobacter sp. BT559]|uniref:tetratricopeptide repeat protein n=1 Tax=Hymenobacter sp. BT559 TaxID=2795729 RepID=UPI0018EA8881|nr:tetratricopeptide repeat protein [Hymenobacter sp. BT559]MBJ6145222.1 hypothetical protein [Hymenobacter sp. BT559]
MADFSFVRRSALVPGLLAALAVGLAIYYYFTGEAATLPLVLVPHLAPLPLALDSVAVGPAHLPVPANGYLTTLTHDFAGPFTQSVAAGVWLGLLATGLAGWLAVVSMLRRPAFLAGTLPVIFLLMSLNVDTLEIFQGSRQGFLILSLSLLGGTAFGLHAFGGRVGIRWRILLFGALVAGLVWLIFAKTSLPVEETLLQLAAYATPGGAVLVAALVLWVGVENIRALVWFNTQAERPESRYGLLPLVLASALYLGALAFYYWSNGEVKLLFGLRLDPLVLLLPAVLAGGLGLPQRLPSYGAWLPYAAARSLYWLLAAGAAGALGYALATVNTPLLSAARSFTTLALLWLGAAFLLYVLINFGSLLRQRLRVYRVVFEPRRLPFFTVYILGLAAIGLTQMRASWPLLDQVEAGQYNLLGDLARQQSESRPDDLALALLAERYYAESGDVLDRFNRTAQLGRAALYRFHDQRQNELNALRRALLVRPDEKLTLRLAALYAGPSDFFEGLDILRKGRRDFPASVALTSDLAQLFTQSALTDSVAFYLDKAEKLAPKSYASQTNQLAFLTQQGLLPAATKLSAQMKPTAKEPALRSNQTLLALLTKASSALPATAKGPLLLSEASFAALYHDVLWVVQRSGAAASWLPHLQQLAAQPENGTYYEQLVFLQALLLHKAGRELAARQTLAPLAAGTSASAAYYQYLLGIWQLQQQQYATAAAQFDLAAEHGLPLAPAARGWALALGGPADSARVAAQRLATSADTAQRPAGRQLLAALASTSKIELGNQAPASGSQLLKQAQQAEQDPAKAAKLYQQLLSTAPFNEKAVLAAARFYTARKQPSDAYEALRLGLVENPSSVPLQQAFVLAAADAGLAELAEPALAQLRTHLDAATYANLLTQFAARRAAHAAAMAAFAADAAPVPTSSR